MLVVVIWGLVIILVVALMATHFNSGSMAKSAINLQKKILNENEEALKEIANKSAEINKEAVKATASAVKEGFSEKSEIFCKHCGTNIDSDSKFCKKCGKEQ